MSSSVGRREKYVAGFAIACALAAGAWLVIRQRQNAPSCGPGFVRQGTRCCPPSTQSSENGACAKASTCPAPLVLESGDCARPRSRISIPATHLVIGASDWEAEGLVAPREVDVAAFAIDALEVSRGEIDPTGGDHARAANRIGREDAQSFCSARGGRLPTDDEWTAAAAGAGHPGRRYPWGDTGAVCRRAAWGLLHGPCEESSLAGPDTIGAHPDGSTTTGIHDLAGNVAEWVAADPKDPARGIVRGGSFKSALAADLRTWARQEVAPNAVEDWIGFRCAYD